MLSPVLKHEKEHTYQEVIRTLDTLIYKEEEKYQLDIIGKMSLICAVIKNAFPQLTFIGFYRIVKPGLLQIGPYQGEVIACGNIPFDRGVCGACATSSSTIIVPDVSKFPGYIACHQDTRSEIVVPVKINGNLSAVFDLDSKERNGFDQLDKKSLELIVRRFL